ncbi:MAG: hypothetical protein Kow00121_26540 [Elainellaceae cyanobacterium]
MSQDKTLELAKAGNAQAIAAIINKTLEPKGISIKATSSNGCLTLVAESPTIPKQEVVVDFLRNGIIKLEPTNIAQVVIRGRATGQTTNSWQETFTLVPEVLEPVEPTKFDNSSKAKVLVNATKLDSGASSPLSKAGIQSSSQRSNPIQQFGWILFVIGSGLLLIGLTYDPTVSSGVLNTERTYNIGMISNKTTYTNTGGFTGICGAIFATYSRRRSENAEKP